MVSASEPTTVRLPNDDDIASAIRVAMQHTGDRIVLDLRDVTFVDSAGLGALLEADRSLRATGRLLALCNLPDQLKLMLRTSGLAHHFAIVRPHQMAITLSA